jgi:hypothetical protein
VYFEETASEISQRWHTLWSKFSRRRRTREAI